MKAKCPRKPPEHPSVSEGRHSHRFARAPDRQSPAQRLRICRWPSCPDPSGDSARCRKGSRRGRWNRLVCGRSGRSTLCPSRSPDARLCGFNFYAAFYAARERRNYWGLRSRADTPSVRSVTVMPLTASPCPPVRESPAVRRSRLRRDQPGRTIALR